MINSFEYVMKNGITTDDTYPYVEEAGTCKNTTGEFKITTYHEIFPVIYSCTHLYEAIANQPVSVGVMGDASWQHYTGGAVWNTCD